MLSANVSEHALTSKILLPAIIREHWMVDVRYVIPKFFCLFEVAVLCIVLVVHNIAPL